MILSNKKTALVIPSVIILTIGRIIKVARILLKNTVFSLGFGLLAGSLTSNPTIGIIAFAVSMIMSSGTSIVLNLIPPDEIGLLSGLDALHEIKLGSMEVINLFGIFFFAAKFGLAAGGVPGAVAARTSAFIGYGAIIITCVTINKFFAKAPMVAKEALADLPDED